MRFAYYDNLSRKEKRAYDDSDKRRLVPLRDPTAFSAELAAIESALKDADRARTETATRDLVRGLVQQLDAPPVTVRVLATRPSDDDGELHGYYEMDDAGCRLRVWMKTAAHQRPVAFRSFVRTVLHELCHHLDFARDQLDYSFHTEGFFARESHLARQLLGPGRTRKRPPSTTEQSQDAQPDPARPASTRPRFLDAVGAASRVKPPKKSAQLGLFDDDGGT